MHLVSLALLCSFASQFPFPINAVSIGSKEKCSIGSGKFTKSMQDINAIFISAGFREYDHPVSRSSSQKENLKNANTSSSRSFYSWLDDIFWSSSPCGLAEQEVEDMPKVSTSSFWNRHNPITFYRKKVVPWNKPILSGWTHLTVNVDVVTHIHAEYKLPFTTKCDRNSFSATFDGRMRELDARPIIVSLIGIRKDEKGHILASQLCGPTTDYNLAPQTPALNRNVGAFTGWINFENSIRKILRTPNCEAKLILDIYPSYRSKVDRRPRGFTYCVKYIQSSVAGSLQHFKYFSNE